MRFASGSKSRRSIVGGVALLALAVALPWWFSKQPTEAGRRLAEALAWMEAHPPKLSDRSEYYANREQKHRDAVSLAAQRWYEELLKQYPDFQITFRDVPDDQNGFLQMLELVESMEDDSLLPPELAEMLGGRCDWDPEAFKDWFASNRDLFDRLLAIAELPDHSVKGLDIPRYSFVTARPAKQISDVFLAAARIAIESGDSDGAFRYHAASMNLASHYDNVEMTTLLAKTVSILVRLNTTDSFQEHILPHIADDPSQLTRWRETLAHQDLPDTEVPRIMAGEWNITIRDLILPPIISGEQHWQNGFGGEPEPFHLPDPAETIAAYTDFIRAIQAWGEGKAPAPTYSAASFSHLSHEGQGVMNILHIGAESWFRGMDRSNTRLALNDALLAIALGEEPPVEPITGEPFLWDPASRTLSPPAGAPADIDPLQLPAAP